jgi:hypothetical protein
VPRIMAVEEVSNELKEAVAAHIFPEVMDGAAV